jgi:Protein of unknown function (DUF3684)
LREITVWMNDHKLLHLKKKVDKAQPMVLPNVTAFTSSENLFTMRSVDICSVQLDATEIDTSTTITTFLRTASGNLNVQVAGQLSAEMERTTKKKPPSTTAIRILYTGYDEKQASAGKDSVFKDLIPFPGQGHIFIGFQTHQTTGFCSHVAGRFIPTVERESLDFVEPCLNLWNRDGGSVGANFVRRYHYIVGRDCLVALTADSPAFCSVQTK